MRNFAYEDEEGETEGATVYISDVESSVLGPDGEPLRKRRCAPVGFRLKPRKKSRK